MAAVGVVLTVNKRRGNSREARCGALQRAAKRHVVLDGRDSWRCRVAHDLKLEAPFMSPEMLQEAEYDMRTDVWSYGATIYLLVCAPYLM